VHSWILLTGHDLRVQGDPCALLLVDVGKNMFALLLVVESRDYILPYKIVYK
jgi:hypothetical protein